MSREIESKLHLLIRFIIHGGLLFDITHVALQHLTKEFDKLLKSSSILIILGRA